MFPTYNINLVILSVLLSMCASYNGLDLISRIRDQRGELRWGWLSWGALSLGQGIWAMHYTGMLALRLPVEVHYEIVLVLLSVLIAVLASGTVLALVSRGLGSLGRKWAASVVMGAGIGGMHYVGMAAMRMDGECRYDHSVVLLSLIMAVCLSWMALRVCEKFREQTKLSFRKVSGSALMGIAIAGMHYTGMAAVQFSDVSMDHAAQNTITGVQLGWVSVALVAAAISLSSTVSALVDSKLSRYTASLAASERQYRALTEQVPGITYVSDPGPHGVWRHVSPRIQEILGYTAEEWIAGQGLWVTRMHPDDRDRVFTSEIQATREGSKVRSEYRLFSRTGAVVWVRDEGVIVRDPVTGDLVMQGLLLDITDRKRAEESLEQSLITAQDALKKLADQSFALDQHAMVSIADLQGKILYVNDKTCQTSRYSREELIGKDHRLMNSGFHGQSFFAEMYRTILAGRVWHGEIRNRSKDGAHYWVDTSIVPTLGLDRKPINYVAICTDITNRKLVEEALVRAKEEAEAANRAKSAFLANMSHEIRTPLNGILGTAELLLSGDPTPEQRELLDLSKSSGEALLTVINDILDFSKIESGKLDLEAIDFDLHDCIMETVRSLSLRASAKQLELICDIDSSVPEWVAGDPGRLRQILINLIGNALKFTERGEVSLRAELAKGVAGNYEILFSVIDTGIGISPEKQELIFEAFSQADGSTTRHFGGTGLGLTICRRLVGLMGGKLRVESSPGKGSTFSFNVVLAAGEHPMPSPVDQSLDRLRELSVLVVDDNRISRHVFTEMTKSWAMKVWSAQNGEQALSVMQEMKENGHIFDVILLDVQMPAMDGFQVAEAIRAEPAFAATRIVVLTSVGQLEGGKQWRELGIDMHLSKPVLKSDLARAILFALDGQRAVNVSDQAQAAPDQAQANRAVSMNILVAEDNPVNQHVVRQMLSRMGYSCTVVSTGREAVTRFIQNHFDAILMDVQMPDMDGFSATTMIRQAERARNTHTPILALTAHAMKGDREKCLAAGMDGYISKPLNMQELEAALAPIRDRKHAATSKWNPEFLRESLGGNEELIAELQRIFLADSPKLVARMEIALNNDDSRQLAEAAHSLKGEVGYFGVAELSRTVLKLEESGISGRLQGAPELLSALRLQLNDLWGSMKA